MTGRFAPTPSGRMHIGNMVAMMAAWLDARSRGQRMLLRIEDIDMPRVLPDADRWIMDDLTWFGMDWDGEPVYQSQRLDVYEQALGLIAGGDWDVADGSVDGSVDGSADGSAGGLSVMFGDSDGDLAGVSADGPASGPAGGSAGYSGIGSAGVSVDGLAGASGNPAVAGNLTAAGDPTAAGNPAATNAHGHIYPCFCSRADIRAASAPQEGDGFQIYPEPAARSSATTRGKSPIASPTANGTPYASPCRNPAVPAASSPSPTASSARKPSTCRAKSATPSSADPTDCSPTNSSSLWTISPWASTPSCAGATCCAPPRCRRGSAGCSWKADSGSGWDDWRIGRIRHNHALRPRRNYALRDHPEYAHIPLIDNAAGRRLAKRERSLDMGALRKRGVTAEQVAGYCAYLLALIPEPEPCTPSDLLREFTWEPLRRDHADRTLDPASPQCPNWLADAVG